jgi:CheY-like chemotaxis protein
MLRDLNLTARQRADLEIIGSSGKRLLALINDVLDLSKIETGRVELQERDFDLWHMLLGLEEMFSLRAETKGLALSFERAPSVPQYVRADENKLRQVLINLLSNAIKSTCQGSIGLRADFTGKGEERVAALEFQVRDTGMGIAPEELDAIFDPFVQTARGIGMDEGTGLGMPISRQSARMMGGDLLVSSDGVGEGTSFQLIVPVRVGEAARVGTTQATRWAMGVELEPGQPAWRLLVVEDAAANRELLVQLLQTLGFDLRQAANGQEAITIWEQWEPHLIWMDVRMPVMGGVEATRRIKATARGEETIVVALTASSFDEEREAILSAGCDDFVCKPFRRADILEVMAKHLGVRYIYRDDIPDDAAEAGNLVTAATLSALPTEWLAAFWDAIQALDMEAAGELVDQIAGMDELLARALADLITNYRFDTLQAIMEKIEW